MNAILPPSVKIASTAILNQILKNRSMIEGPSVVAGVEFFDVGRFGAFSFCRGGWFGNVTSIGRFCSLAPSLIVGPTEHNTSILTTSTFLNSSSWDFEELETFKRRNKDAIAPALRAIRDPATRNQRHVVIGNDVWIGQNALIRKGVTIGDGAVIGANSVVSKDVAPYEMVGGSPAKHIRLRFDQETVERLVAVKWWEWSLRSLDGIRWDDAQAASIELQKRKESGSYEEANYPAIEYKDGQ